LGSKEEEEKRVEERGRRLGLPFLFFGGGIMNKGR
jgi:hypothetical protein